MENQRTISVYPVKVGDLGDIKTFDRGGLC